MSLANAQAQQAFKDILSVNQLYEIWLVERPTAIYYTSTLAALTASKLISIGVAMTLPALPFPGSDWRAGVASLTASGRAELAKRARAAPLYAHAYALHLNMRFGALTPEDLLDFATRHGLRGVKIHVEDGEGKSLAQRDTAGRTAFGIKAKAQALDLHIETSATDAATLTELVAIGHATGASALRFYPRHSGPVSSVIAQTVADLRLLSSLDPTGKFRLLLEQHEDLCSAELVQIVRAVGNPRLHLLFDFGNMINALEAPLDALSVQAPHISDVHIKDCEVLADRGGWAHLACISGSGDIPMQALLVGLLLLGKTPQILAFGLEEEEGYYAPAFRFPNEAADPLIPPRGASETDPGMGDIAARLAAEYAAAEAQIAFVRHLLEEIALAAESA